MRARALLIAVLLSACGGSRVEPARREPRERAREPVVGVTVTNPWVAASPEGEPLRRGLRALRRASGRRPMVRVVFDAGVDRVRPRYEVDAEAYRPHVAAIAEEARVMGELLDSAEVHDYDIAAYRARACEYRAALGDLVDVWEVGNEVNGEWLGPDVVAKVAAAVAVLRADARGFTRLCPGARLRERERPFELALTLYYNGDETAHCWERPEHAMQRWAADHLARAAWAAELDYVFVSFYEDDCDGVAPRWQDVFERLGGLFPRSALGIGECGTTDASRKAREIERYYGMTAVEHPRFVGGYFWWYWSEDLHDPTVTRALERALHARARASPPR